MKRLLIFLFVIIELVSYGQAIIGMGSTYSLFPAAAGNSTVGVSFGDTITIYAAVVNTGNATFNGLITVSAKRDTTAGVSCGSNSFSLTLIPGGSFTTSISFTTTSGPNAFKSGGNGNTIVVWPLIITGSGVNGDSVRPIIYINDPNSVYEFEKTLFHIYPNPVLKDLTIKTPNLATYHRIVIYDVFARKVKEIAFKESIDVSELHAGSYWMIIESQTKSYRIPFIKQ